MGPGRQVRSSALDVGGYEEGMKGMSCARHAHYPSVILGTSDRRGEANFALPSQAHAEYIANGVFCCSVIGPGDVVKTYSLVGRVLGYW